MRPRGRRGCGPRANLLRVAGLEAAARRRDGDKRSTGPSDEDITPDLERVSYPIFRSRYHVMIHVLDDVEPSFAKTSLVQHSSSQHTGKAAASGAPGLVIRVQHGHHPRATGPLIADKDGDSPILAFLAYSARFPLAWRRCRICLSNREK